MKWYQLPRKYTYAEQECGLCARSWFDVCLCMESGATLAHSGDMKGGLSRRYENRGSSGAYAQVPGGKE